MWIKIFWETLKTCKNSIWDMLDIMLVANIWCEMPPPAIADVGDMRQPLELKGTASWKITLFYYRFAQNFFISFTNMHVLGLICLPILRNCRKKPNNGVDAAPPPSRPLHDRNRYQNQCIWRGRSEVKKTVERRTTAESPEENVETIFGWSYWVIAKESAEGKNYRKIDR